MEITDIKSHYSQLIQINLQSSRGGQSVALYATVSSPSPAATECHPREKREILESGVGAGVLGIAPGEAGRKAAELIERLHRVRQQNNGGQRVKTTLGQQPSSGWTWKLNVEMMVAWRHF